MQANWDEKYLNQVEHFSYVNTEWKVFTQVRCPTHIGVSPHINSFKKDIETLPFFYDFHMLKEYLISFSTKI